MARDEIARRIEQCCAEAGYGVLVQCFEIIRDREVLDDRDLLDAVEHLDLDELYENLIGPAIDEIETALKGTFA